ncbi:MAG: prepilin-type N-terminal cleavage/methylation domain-containing protein [Eubacteriales bacterium]
MLYSKNKKRGFTLVELIVVLVILAILAALLIPALTGYIDKAKKDQVIAETRMLHEAIQTEMVELYGSNTNWKPTIQHHLANSTGTVIGNNPILFRCKKPL